MTKFIVTTEGRFDHIAVPSALTLPFAFAPHGTTVAGRELPIGSGNRPAASPTPGWQVSIGNSVTNGGAGQGDPAVVLATASAATALYFSALFQINDTGRRNPERVNCQDASAARRADRPRQTQLPPRPTRLPCGVNSQCLDLRRRLRIPPPASSRPPLAPMASRSDRFNMRRNTVRLVCPAPCNGRVALRGLIVGCRHTPLHAIRLHVHRSEKVLPDGTFPAFLNPNSYVTERQHLRVDQPRLLGPHRHATQTAPGFFQFIDLVASNYPTRFLPNCAPPNRAHTLNPPRRALRRVGRRRQP